MTADRDGAAASGGPNRLASLPLFRPPTAPAGSVVDLTGLARGGQDGAAERPPVGVPQAGSLALAGPPAGLAGLPDPGSGAAHAPGVPTTPGGPGSAAAGLSAPVDWAQVRAFRQQAAEQLTLQLQDRTGLDEAGRREMGRSLIVTMLREHARSAISQGTGAPTPEQDRVMAAAVFDALFGLGRLQRLVDDPLVENIEIRGFDRVHLVYGDGRVQVGPPVADSDEELIETLAFLAAQSGRAFSPLSWELDLRLHGGHRLAARAWRCPRPTVVIRVHRYTDVDLADLQRLGMLDASLVHFLRAGVRAGKAIVVAGAQGAGKTTLVRALCNELDPWESIATIETEYELHLDELPDRHHRVTAYEARPGSGGERGPDGRAAGEVTLDALLHSVLRTNVSRIIVGEVRGPEVIPMLKAAQSSTGTLSTTHAHDARAAIDRLVTCALESGPHVTADFAHLLIASGIDLIVQVATVDDTHAGGRRQRHVSEVLEVAQGGENGRPSLTDVFVPGPDGRAVPRTRPSFLAELVRAGLDLGWLELTDGAWERDVPAAGAPRAAGQADGRLAEAGGAR